MKAWRRKSGLVVVSVMLALLHYAAFTVSYARSHVLPLAEQDEGWRIVAGILSFPFGFLGRLVTAIDLFPVLIAANSLLWGAVLGAVVMHVFGWQARRAGASN